MSQMFVAGNKYRYIKGRWYPTGTIVELLDDDGGNYLPMLVKEVGSEDKMYIERESLEPLEEASDVESPPWECPGLDGYNVGSMKVDLPNPHYQTDIQPIEFMQANMSPEAFQGLLRGNIIKYTARIGKKDDALKEALKIADYSRWLVLAVQGKKIDPRKD